MTYTITALDGSDLHHKSEKGILSVDDAQGIVKCVVAAIGNKDSVGDIIVPGAFDGSLKRRNPRVVWGHNWNEPIGKVLDIAELPPNDPRLPDKLKQAGVGGLLAEVQFNLASERGREAFNTVAFYGEEQEWSIGYKTIRNTYDPVRQANLLQEVELFEVSPVLHGANRLTGTLSVKIDEGHAHAITEEVAFVPGEAEEKNLLEPQNKEVLERAFSQAFQREATLRYVDDKTAIFVTPEGATLGVPYRMDGHNPETGALRVIFGNPKPVSTRFTYSPTAQVKPHDCECGLHVPKSGEPEDIETKIGRVLSSQNLTKLRQAFSLLQEVVSSQPEGDPESGIERKLPDGKAYLAVAEKSEGETLVLGHPEHLTGEVFHGETKTLEDVANLVRSMESMGVKGNHCAIVAPTKAGSPESGVSVWVGTEMPTKTRELMGPLFKAKGFESSIEQKSYFGTSTKTFGEVFVQKP